MRSPGKQWVLAVLVGCLVVAFSVRHLAAQRRTSITITRLYTSPDGLAHVGTTEVKLRHSTLRAGLDESASLKVSGAQFLRWPPGFVWEWHTAAQSQYVITISGHGEVEVAGGQKIQLKPGQIVLADDVMGKGHITRTVGSEDLVLLLVPIAAQ